MLPTTFEFRWDTGHMIFFGLFYAVVIAIFTSLIFVAVKSIIDVYRHMTAANEANATEHPEDPREATNEVIIAKS